MKLPNPILTETSLAVSLGVGKRASGAKRVVRFDGTPAELASVIAGHTAPDAWWSPHRWEKLRRNEQAWRAASAIVVDVDYHDGGKHVEIPEDIATHALASLRGAGVNLAHATPRGLRAVVVLDAPITSATTYKAACRAAWRIVADALASEPSLRVDELGDLARMFWCPSTTVEGMPRQAEVMVARAHPWSVAELGAVPVVDATPAPSPRAAGDDFDAAVRAFNERHTPAGDWGAPGSGDCPTCTHRECFGSLPEAPSRWCCWSSNHGDVGLPLANGQGRHGDALDIEVHRRGLAPGASSRAQVLRADGFLGVQAPRVVDDTTSPTPYEPPPVHVLPPAARALVKAAAAAIDCDPALVFLPALATLSAAVGRSRAVLLRPGQTESALLWCAVIADSGSGKTPAMSFATAPLRQLEAEAFEKWKREHAEYESAMREAARERDEEPTPPRQPRFYASDVTIERVATMLAGWPRGFLLCRDELAGWLAFDRYSGSKGAEQAQWLSIHSGSEIAVDRKSEGLRIFVPSSFVAIVGGIQPGVFMSHLSTTPGLIESGLLARVLFAAPPQKPRRWNESGVSDEVREDWADLVRKIAEDDETRTLKLTHDAKALWVRWFDALQAYRDTANSAERASLAKIESAAARIALVIHVARQVDDPKLADVDIESMRAGVEIAAWFAVEAARIYRGIEGDRPAEHTREARVRSALLAAGDAGLSHSDIQDLTGRNLTAGELDALLAGMPEVEEARDDARGGRPALRYRLRTNEGTRERRNDDLSARDFFRSFVSSFLRSGPQPGDDEPKVDPSGQVDTAATIADDAAADGEPVERW